MKKIIRKDSWRLRNPLKLTQTKWVEPPTQRTITMTTLHADLCHFTGTEAYHRISLSQHVCTDGVNFLREQGNCYWLPEAIASHLLTPERCLRKYGEDFANFHIWTLTPKDGGGYPGSPSGHSYPRAHPTKNRAHGFFFRRRQAVQALRRPSTRRLRPDAAPGTLKINPNKLGETK